MTRDAKIIGSSIILGMSTIGVSIASLDARDDSVMFPAIIAVIALFLLVKAWTGRSVVSYIREFFGWQDSQEKLENRRDESSHGDGA